MATTPLPAGLDAKALETPAIFVNHFQMMKLGAHLVRITFGEAPVPNAPNYRSAIIMAVEDARQLASVLLQVANAEPQNPSPPEGSLRN
jgi:hypothetical protein